MSQHWHTLAPGIKYMDLNKNIFMPWAHIHTFSIDLNKNAFAVVTAHSLSKKNAAIKEYAKIHKALLAINGGFFDNQFHPLGLRISHTQILNPLKSISWWGIFYISHQIPFISSYADYHPDERPEFAVQSGPRLIVNGVIPKLKGGLAERTALGIDAHNHVILVVTENKPMTTFELADLLLNKPIQCQNALNLDGGSSSQLFAKNGSFKAYAPGFSKVGDAIIVYEK